MDDKKIYDMLIVSTSRDGSTMFMNFMANYKKINVNNFDIWKNSDGKYNTTYI